jgi:RNA-directed DNA polymerase
VLRPNGDCGEIRESHFVSVSHRPVHAEKTRGGSGDVPRVFTGSARPILSGRQKQSSFKNLRRRRRISATAVLDAFSSFDSLHDISPTSNRSSFNSGSRSNALWMGQKKKIAGAIRVNAPVSLAATGTTGQTPVLDARTGTTTRRTRTTTSVVVASVSAQLYRSANAKALRAGQSKCGQPVLSPLGKHASGFDITQSSETSKGVVGFSMGAKHRNLIQKITTIENLREAYRKTSKGKRMSWGYLEFKEYAEANLLLIQEELKDGAYSIGPYRQFTIYEPKPRLISALDFKDRLVQHALCNVISPIFENGLLPHTFACRVGLGTHAGVRHVQARLRSTGHKYFLKTDFSKFFPSVNRARLHEMIYKKIRCEKTLNILREIIPTEGVGIPIGSLTSQLFANVYGNAADRFIHFDLGHKHWARYMDDIVILDSDPHRLRDSFERISEFGERDLGLRISKWQASPVSRGVNFLGYRIWPTHKLLRKDSVTRAKRKVQKFISHKDDESLQKFIASWSGHAKWADTHNLFNWMEKRHGLTF